MNDHRTDARVARLWEEFDRRRGAVEAVRRRVGDQVLFFILESLSEPFTTLEALLSRYSPAPPIFGGGPFRVVASWFGVRPVTRIKSVRYGAGRELDPRLVALTPGDSLVDDGVLSFRDGAVVIDSRQLRPGTPRVQGPPMLRAYCLSDRPDPGESAATDTEYYLLGWKPSDGESLPRNPYQLAAGGYCADAIEEAEGLALSDTALAAARLLLCTPMKTMAREALDDAERLLGAARSLRHAVAADIRSIETAQAALEEEARKFVAQRVQEVSQ